MNPLIQQQFKEIESLAGELRRVLLENKKELKKKRTAFADLTERYWGRGSKLAVRDRNEADYEGLCEENDRLRRQNAEFRERLEHILSCTKTLIGEFKS